MKSFSISHTMLCSHLPCYIIFFIALHVHKLDSVNFKVKGPDHPITAIAGKEIVLSCHLLPRMSAENMEVRWYRTQFLEVIHLYQDGVDHYEKQMPAYQGRTELLRDGIADGNIALRIYRITPADEGHYSCFIQSSAFYGEAMLELKVAGFGSDPRISIEGYQDRGIRVVCESAGWYPEPKAQWRDQNGQLLASSSETKSKDANGLFQMQISIVTTENSNRDLSCFVRNPSFNQERESTIYITDVFFPRVSPWMVAVCVILALLGFLIFPAIYYFWKKHEAKGELLAELRWSNVRQYAVDVTLDPDTAYPHLVLSENRKSVEWRSQHQDVPDCPKRFDCVTCVLGYEGFTSGRHYWEIDVGDGTNWGVGVARETVSRKGWITPMPEDGFWAVEECRGQYRALTSIEMPLSLSKSIRKIGIYLDYEGGRVAFYDLVREDPFFTFTAHFTEKIFPFFLVYSQLTVCPWGDLRMICLPLVSEL
ncbi:butyrophilin subfamily 1 member A1-like isoform X3 [Chelonoidis abingdonii]|uniref:Butyrophilin subfamily 1 member A1-like n=1 Tax=Chelonoidis abingdonii TaxID=106734 RepID=A0A8C0J3Q1_CHEAB|nr:butyrophilin subfamily 1 member A1-like isoform X1 [Chelonoidis abingdonii]XP_032635420.1 butyrophilin subfamily 1 member A1-like isoform X1 [Chelonoidis abingdonii]